MPADAGYLPGVCLCQMKLTYEALMVVIACAVEL